MDAVVRDFVMKTGERYCVLVDPSSTLPLFYPNLYVTTQVRNKSLSLSAMRTALGGIQVLLRWADEEQTDLEGRFRAGEYLAPHELDSIRDYCQKRFGSPRTAPGKNVLAFRARLREDRVARDTEYSRLTSIADYLKWLSASTLGGPQVSEDRWPQIDRMVKGLEARRPTRRNRSGRDQEKGLTEHQVSVAAEVFDPSSDMNPAEEPSVRVRNQVIFLLLSHLGIRGGELLNIRIRDFDFTKGTLLIARRADEKDDPRKHQPQTKTTDRRIPISPLLAHAIKHYIQKERKGVLNAHRHDYLIVSHKAGPTEGQPLSISGYKRVIRMAKQAAPELEDLHGHMFRHTWNYMFSMTIDSLETPVTPEEQEQQRSYLNGWKQGSGTASTYNQQYIRKKAQEASLALQEGMLRLPEGVNETKKSK